jgi:hypothetical protein
MRRARLRSIVCEEVGSARSLATRVSMLGHAIVETFLATPEAGLPRGTQQDLFCG